MTYDEVYNIIHAIPKLRKVLVRFVDDMSVWIPEDRYEEIEVSRSEKY